MARNRTTRYQRRMAHQNAIGFALCFAVALAFAGLVAGAYYADKARGITVSESLESAGL